MTNETPKATQVRPCEYDGCRFYFEGLENNCTRKECPYPKEVE